MSKLFDLDAYQATSEELKNYIESSISISATESSSALEGEVSRAKNAENEIAKDLSDEITRATNVENTLSSNKLDKNQGANNSGKIAGINSSGDIVPMIPQGIVYNSETQCLEYGTDQRMNLNVGIPLDDTLSKSGYAADAAKVGELKSDYETVSYGHFPTYFEPTNIRGTVSATKENRYINVQWSSKLPVYKGLQITSDFNELKGKLVLARVTNNTDLDVDVSHTSVRLLMSYGENWGSPILYFNGEIKSHDSQMFVFDADSISYNQESVWIVIGSTVFADGNFNIELFLYEKKAILPVNADTLDGKSLEDISNESANNAKNMVIEYIEKRDTNNVICWGDSLTEGAPVYGAKAYPGKLATLLGNDYVVYNYGVGGETPHAILSRMGAYPVYAEPFTMPSSGSVDLNLKTIGLPIGWKYKGPNDKGINPITVGGIKGNIVITEPISGNWVYTFTRLESGESKTFDRPVFVQTKASINCRNDISIIFIGENSDYSSEDELCEEIQTAIDWLDTNRYIIVSMHTSKQTDTLTRKERIRFGEHFLYTKEYLSKYGLSDVGLTPTEEDETAMQNGEVPPQLLVDKCHFAENGYTVLADLIYRKGKDLGYW